MTRSGLGELGKLSAQPFRWLAIMAMRLRHPLQGLTTLAEGESNPSLTQRMQTCQVLGHHLLRRERLSTLFLAIQRLLRIDKSTTVG